MVEASKWSDDRFLDKLRGQTDPLADAAVQRLIEQHGVEAASMLFRSMNSNAEALPDDAPEALREFVEQTSKLPSDLDYERLERGGAVFFQHAFSAAVVMLASSLPSGYSAPCLTHILTISGDLEQHPFKRLMGVVQLLVNISVVDAFQPQGEALVTAQKMRLLHAGIRAMTAKYRPDFEKSYGPPVNHEDMLATIMAFSWLVIDGLQKLGVDLTEQEGEDYYYLWRTFAQMTGIHPDGQPDSSEFVPQTVAQAREFYDAYSRRNYAAAAENPAGIRLTADNLTMMKRLIPWPLRLVGFGWAPRVASQALLNRESLERVGLRPLPGHEVCKGFLHRGLQIVQGTIDDAPDHFSERLGRTVFQHIFY